MRPRNCRAWKVTFSAYEQGMKVTAEGIEGAGHGLDLRHETMT